MVPHYLKFTLIVLILNSAVFATAQGIAWNSEKKIVTGGHASNTRPRILALDETHGIIVWGNEHAQTIHYCLWEGDSLSSVYNIDMKNTKAFITSWASTEIAGKNQYVYIVYKEDPADVGRIYLLRSTDYGKTFSHQIIAVESNGFKSRFPGVAIDKDNHPIVSYMRFKEDWSQPEYVSIRSSDYGNTFDPFTEVTDRSKGEACDCCPVGMETDGERIAVLYRNNRSNIRNMTAAISLDNGNTYSITKELDTANWLLLSCPSTGGDAFFQDQYLHTCWSTGRTGVSKVFYSRLNIVNGEIDAFRGFNHSISRNFQQTYPRIAGKKDTIGIVWGELINNMDVFFSYVVGDDVSQFDVNTERINNQRNSNQASPDVAYANGWFYTCWPDANDNSITFKKGQLNNVTKQKELNAHQLDYLRLQDGIQFNNATSFDSWKMYAINGKLISMGQNTSALFVALKERGIYIMEFKRKGKRNYLKVIY